MFKYVKFINRIVISCNHISFKRYFSRFSSTKSIRYISETILSWKVNIFIADIKLKDFFSINKQITIISIIMHFETKFCVCFTKLILNFSSVEPKLPLIPKVGPSPCTKKIEHERMNYYQHIKL